MTNKETSKLNAVCCKCGKREIQMYLLGGITKKFSHCKTCYAIICSLEKTLKGGREDYYEKEGSS